MKTPMNTPVRTAALLLFAVMICSLVPMSWERNHIYHDGVTVWESIVRSSPNKRRPHQNYGQALSTAGYYNEALREFKTVLAMKDDGSVPPRDIYREIGVVYFRLGLFDESIISWQKGLQYAPFDSGLLNNLSVALMKQKRYDEALSYAETAIRSSEYMPEPLNTAGEIYLMKNEPRKAAEHFKKFLELRPEDARGYWNVALALRQAGEYREALQYANQFLAIERDPRYRQTAAELIEHLQGKIKSAPH
jgi:tetratricopeptide (TPR) repeat protein